MAKTLIVSFCGIGDFVFSLPYLRTIKADSSEGFDLLTFPNGIRALADPLQLFDHISEFVQPQKWQSTSKSLVATWKEQWQCAWDIRQKKYDRIIWPFAQTTFKKRLLSFLFGGRQSYLHKGRTYWSSRPLFPRERLLPYQPTSHVIERNAALVAELGLSLGDKFHLDLGLSSDEKKRAQDWSREHAGQKKMVGFHIGGNLKFNSARTWKPEYFSALADYVVEKFDLFPVFFSSNSPDELAVLRSVRSAMKHASSEAVGLPIRDAAALIAEQTMFVGNDSSLVHLAGAANVKTIVIHGPTDPKVTGAWGVDTHAVRLNLPCSPCYEADFSNQCPGRWCMSALTPDKIFSLLNALFHQPADSLVRPPKHHDINVSLAQTIYNDADFRSSREAAQEDFNRRVRHFSK